MGMKFRKSINLGGGTKLNLSKSGVGISTGVKGFRVSKNTSGRSRVTASLPGTGLSYTKEYGSSGSSGNSQVAPAPHSSYSGGSSAPSGGGSGKKDKPPFFQRPGVIFLCLLLFAPLGIFLMWRYIPQWKTGMKVALSILFGLVFVFALVPKAGDNAADADQPPVVQQQVDGTKTLPNTKTQKPVVTDKQEAAQEPQDAAEAVTDTESKADDATAQEPVQTPQETQQAVVVQPKEPPKQEQPKQEQPKQEQPVQQEEFKDEDSVVYITPDGKKYHKKGCRTLKVEPTEININDAIAQGRTACKVCGG